MISRTLCEMMGGRLLLDSVLGRGTRIDVRLDLPALQPLPCKELSDNEVQAPTRQLTILVVDDYPANRLLMSRQLSRLGHSVMDAEDGQQGYEKWCEFDFDVVITDCNMPVLSGYELAGAIRDEERAQGLPPTLILGFTANAQPEERVRCLEAGMDDCLFKPIRLADLSAWLASRFAGGPVPIIDAPSGPEIDLSGLEQYVGKDHELITQLLRDLFITNRTDRDELLEAHASGDQHELCKLAHRIKGGALMVRAVNLIDCCMALEAACSDGHAAQIDDAVEKLQQAMKRLDRHLVPG